MRVVLRADASLQIGTGHVMRCLTLAEELRVRGADCHFICRIMPGNLVKFIQSRGFSVSELAEVSIGDFQPATEDTRIPTAHSEWLGCDWQIDAGQTQDVIASLRPDWLVLDHYALDWRWETAIKSYFRHLMVIDDLADRSHVCDLLLDQNYYSEMTTRYLELVPAKCEMLLGTSHVLLRPEFTLIEQFSRKRDGSVTRIFVFFGGSDPTNQTLNVLLALSNLNLQHIAVDVIIGSSNPHHHTLQKLCNSIPNTLLHCQVSNIAELIDKADLGIGAGGVAMWERCYLGLPTITVTFADNQVKTTEDVATLGAIKYLGRCNSFTADEYEMAIKVMIDSPDEILQMSKISLDLVRPGTQRVADAMERLYSASEFSTLSLLSHQIKG